MSSYVLNGEIPYRVPFPTKSLFPIALKIFGYIIYFIIIKFMLREDDDLFIYEVTTPTPSFSPILPPSRLYLSQVYSRRPPPQPLDLCPPLMSPSSCDPGPSNDLFIALCKDMSHLGWQNAMIEKTTALNDNGTWDLVFHPTRKNVIDCKRVFTVKVNPDGTMARLQARLVAKALHQLDIENAFLNGDLQEEVYMQQPPRKIRRQTKWYSDDAELATC
ncbi:uncharacterized protein E5676_scaffold344G00800 [Cucumis melo var. makuwa]|uniref:Reverse transcriptase Ty1/copia-type domain-containing protein n=1 Tax=Cucumis melo var. makuwa TaxID=1194695 RepID=A0A5D3E2H7_CUCMM|nr:uncharacterized protein E6C27_scaffold56G00290 [Cucumis melo var. makuwa]TYK30313.1 uncharacterized protein E5676_scaffold344G00800 [Cucumis melo var. makuwa]